MPSPIRMHDRPKFTPNPYARHLRRHIGSCVPFSLYAGEGWMICHFSIIQGHFVFR